MISYYFIFFSLHINLPINSYIFLFSSLDVVIHQMDVMLEVGIIAQKICIVHFSHDELYAK